jgi:predicted nucleic acid-binding protein
MKDKIYIDTNVVLYLFDKDQSKKKTALKLLDEKPVISTQVVNEATNNFIRKFNFDNKTCIAEIKFIIDKCKLKLITPETIEAALNLREQFKYSYYDSLHLACALENGCKFFYSEDMHHKQKINGMVILNPFKK